MLARAGPHAAARTPAFPVHRQAATSTVRFEIVAGLKEQLGFNSVADTTDDACSARAAYEQLSAQAHALVEEQYAAAQR